MAKTVFERRETEAVRCGEVTIGGGNPISIQTMTNTDTRDVFATCKQIEECVLAGADIVRVSVPDNEAAQAISAIKKRTPCPVVADIHFDYRLAILALENGADKVRVNPGNLGGQDRMLKVAKAARDRGACLRVGVNSGSLEKDILAKYGRPVPEALVESACRCLTFLEDRGIDGIVVSMKSSGVKDTVKAYSLLAETSRWPFHIGITEAGPGTPGSIKSACGIGALLCLGLGDTLRVSLTGSPAEEVKVAQQILQASGENLFGPELISCPTCGRTQVDLVAIVDQVSELLSGVKIPLKVAVMGCPVNGPGEAKEADVGLACGRQGGVLFSKGRVLGTVPQEKMVESLFRLINEEILARGGSHGA